MPRFDALLARNLGLSRRQVTRLLRAGRVCDLEGRRLDDGRVPCPPRELPRRVLVDGEPRLIHHRFGLLQHKPTGVVTAMRDARHRTAYALLEGAPLFRELRAVGRLDLDTSGLLLWTTDGSLLHRLTHPRYGVPREYQAGLAGSFQPPPPGLMLDDGHRPRILGLRELSPSQLHPALRRSRLATVHASITLGTGRFHEVRRIFAALGTEVIDLCRVRYGAVELPATLPPGEHQPIELHAIFADLHPRPAEPAP